MPYPNPVIGFACDSNEGVGDPACNSSQVIVCSVEVCGNFYMWMFPQPCAYEPRPQAAFRRNNVQNTAHGPVYPVGFAAYIALVKKRRMFRGRKGQMVF